MPANTVDPFPAKVFAALQRIPRGKAATYGQLAFIAGRPECARMVGRLLSTHPDAHGLPCHRVVNSQGRTAPGWVEQSAMLKAEGVGFKPNGCVNMEKYGWDFF